MEFRLLDAVSQTDYTDLEFRLAGPNDVSKSLTAHAEHVGSGVSAAEVVAAEHTGAVAKARDVRTEHLLTEEFPWALDMEHELGPTASVLTAPTEHVEGVTVPRTLQAEHEAQGMVSKSRTLAAEHQEGVASARTLLAEVVGVPSSTCTIPAEHTLEYEGPSPRNVVDVTHRNWYVEVR